MKTFRFKFISGSRIVDLDSDHEGHFIALTDNNQVVTHKQGRFGRKLFIKENYRFPCIRAIDEHRFMIVDRRTKGDNNANIYDKQGKIVLSFYAGDAINDILVVNDKIVVTYFDEGVFGDSGPNLEGVAVFDMTGKLIFGVNSQEECLVDDCYCICRSMSNKVLFCPYTSFTLVELNLDSFEMKMWKTPEILHGASVLSEKDGQIIIFSSYQHRKSFFTWDRDSNKVEVFGEWTQRIRGLTNGAFLSFDEKTYTIINPLEDFK